MGCFQENLSGLNFYPVSRSFLEAVDPPTMFTSSIASGLTNANITQYMVVSATLSDISGEKKTEKSMSLLQLELTQSSEEVHTPVFNETSPPLFAASGYLITQVANDTTNKAETGTCSDTVFEDTKESKDYAGS